LENKEGVHLNNFVVVEVSQTFLTVSTSVKTEYTKAFCHFIRAWSKISELKEKSRFSCSDLNWLR